MSIASKRREPSPACAAGIDRAHRPLLSDALRRRCLFLWLPYPSLAQEIEILHARVPGLSDRLARQIALLMQAFRTLPLQKAPGVAESLDEIATQPTTLSPSTATNRCALSRPASNSAHVGVAVSNVA